MKQFARALDLKDDPEVIASYKEYHERVWPEVKEALKEVGVHQMKIWLLGCRLVMIIDVDDDFDPADNFARYMTLHPKIQEWEDIMGQYQLTHPAAKEGTRWADMELVFQLV